MKGDPAIKELVKSLHFYTLQAAAFLNVAKPENLYSVLQKNQEGKLFKSFMKAA